MQQSASCWGYNDVRAPPTATGTFPGANSQPRSQAPSKPENEASQERILALPKVKRLGVESYGVLSLGGADSALHVDGMQYHHRFALAGTVLLEVKYRKRTKAQEYVGKLSMDTAMCRTIQLTALNQN